MFVACKSIIVEMLETFVVMTMCYDGMSFRCKQPTWCTEMKWNETISWIKLSTNLVVTKSSILSLVDGRSEVLKNKTCTKYRSKFTKQINAHPLYFMKPHWRPHWRPHYWTMSSLWWHKTISLVKKIFVFLYLCIRSVNTATLSTLWSKKNHLQIC